MTAEESLNVAVRGHVSRAGLVSEVKMFGGAGFMLNRNLVAAVSQRGLLLGKDHCLMRLGLSGTARRPIGPRGGSGLFKNCSASLALRITAKQRCGAHP